MDPPGMKRSVLFREKSIRLPHSFWCYSSTESEPDGQFVARVGKRLHPFWLFQYICKGDRSGAGIVGDRVPQAVPKSKLLLLRSAARRSSEMGAVSVENRKDRTSASQIMHHDTIILSCIIRSISAWTASPTTATRRAWIHGGWACRLLPCAGKRPSHGRASARRAI